MIRDLCHTRYSTYPAILVKYARNGVPESTTGSCVVGESLKRVASRRTYIADSNREKEEKYPKVEIEPPARGSGLSGNPKRKESEQAGSVEGDGQIRLHIEESSSVIATTKEKQESLCVPYQGDKKCHNTERFHTIIPDNSPA